MVAAVVSLIGILVQSNFGDRGPQILTILNIAVSAALTAALIILYYRQSSILQSQKDLKQKEINLEIRKEHTKVLQQRVVAWHGDTEPARLTDSSLSEQQTDSGLPQVEDLGFKSADGETPTAEPIEESEFNTIPSSLRDDPFLEDFLQNHAKEVERIRKRIERHQSSFSSYREDFIDEFNQNIGQVEESYEIEWEDDFPLWVFNRMLIFIQKQEKVKNCGEYRDIENYIEFLCGNIEVDDNPVKGLELRFKDKNRQDETTIASSKNIEKERATEIPENKILNAGKVGLRRELTPVIKNWPHKKIENAAEELESGKEEVNRLDIKLERYARRPVYNHDCEYIESIDVSGNNHS